MVRVESIGLKVVLFIMYCLLFVSCSDESSNYSVGFIGNFEGANAQPSVESLAAVKLAFDTYWEQKPTEFAYEIIPVDDSWKVEKIREAYAKVASRCDIFFFVTNSTAFRAVYGDVTANSDKLHLLIGGTTTAVSKRDDNIIRPVMDVKHEQMTIAEFFNKRNIKRLLVVQDMTFNPVYSSLAIEYFNRYYDGELVLMHFSTCDVNPEMVSNALKEPDIQYAYILAGGTPRRTGRVTRQICRANNKIKVMTTPWDRGRAMLEMAGQWKGNIIFSSHINLTGENPLYQHFVTNYYDAYQYAPGNFAALAYDSAHMLLRAIQSTGSKDGSVLKRRLIKGEHRTTAGSTSLNNYGDAEGKLYFHALEGDGQYRLLDVL